MMFDRYIGIDYSGAQTPTSSLKGLRVYMAESDAGPIEVLPPPSPRKYWTRRGIAEWLVDRLAEDVPTLVGIDHGFSFPLDYFKAHGLKHDWPTFLDDFHRHWPTDADHVYVDFVREGVLARERTEWVALDGEGSQKTSIRQVGLSFRCSRVSGQVHPRRHPLAALHPEVRRIPRALLAIRWLGHPARAIGNRRGLSRSVEGHVSN